MRRITKKEIKNAIIEKLPHLSCFIMKNGTIDIFNMPNKNPNNLIGGLIIQFDKGNIWFRGYPPCSGGCLDSIDEMIDLLTKIINDELLIVIGYKGENWEETSLQFRDKKIVLEEGIIYDILSWSGKFDKKKIKILS